MRLAGLPIKTTRRRVLPFTGPFKGTYKSVSKNLTFGTETSESGSGSFSFANLQGVQTTVSENHPSWRRRVRTAGFRGDIGGEFYTERTYVLCDNRMQTFGGKLTPPGQVITAMYTGPVWARDPSLLSFPSITKSSNTVLDAWGATAVARTKPTNSVADVTVFLTELLREGLPDLAGASLKRWRTTTDRARKVPAEEYLNYQFGWVPVANDISKLANAITHAELVMNQFQRDSGRLVRRRFDFPIDTETLTEVAKNAAVPAMPASHTALFKTGLPKGRVIKTTTTSRRRWFSGAFTYYLAPDYSTRSGIARAVQSAKKLYGLSLTPETVWNVSPWSWAIDWFSNVGDVLSNISSYMIDGLMMQYGYVMEHNSKTISYTWSGDTYLQDPSIIPAAITLGIETKSRRRANPFGFGVTWGGLSPTQLSIAAAIGLTNTR